jgi:hypothetical protein
MELFELRQVLAARRNHQLSAAAMRHIVLSAEGV